MWMRLEARLLSLTPGINASSVKVVHRMNIAVLELILVMTVVLGLGLWQLWDVNRELRKDRETEKQSESERDEA